MAIADFGGTVLGQPIEVLTVRSSKQAGHRGAETSRMGRHRRPDDAARRLEHRRQPRDVGRGEGEEDPVLRHRRGRRVADRQGLHALYDPLRLRHDRARQRHRQDHSRRRRQELVLPHRGLRLRQATGERRRPTSSRRTEAPWSATCACRSGRRTSPPISSRRRARARRCSRLANAGADTSNSLKAAAEFGLTKTMRPAALLVFLTDVHAMGLDIAQGLVLTTAWYWNIERRDAGLRQPLLRKDQEDADLPPGGLLFRDAAPISTRSRRSARPTPTRSWSSSTRRRSTTCSSRTA